MTWIILFVVLVVSVPLMFINLCILLKQIKSNEDYIITNIIVIQNDLIRLNEEYEKILKQLNNIPKEIIVKNVLKIP